MSIKDISCDPAPRDVTAPTLARREGKDVVPSSKHMDDGVFESTASITRDIMHALAEDFQQLIQEYSEFKDISFSYPAPGNVAALTRAWRVGKDVLSIKRRFRYMKSSKSYAQDLQKEVMNLAYEFDRVHNAVEEARNNLQNVYSHVAEWQASAEKALKEAQYLLGNFEKVSKTRCYVTLPSPSFRYQFSRKAKDKIEDIQKLALEGSDFMGLHNIFSAPAPGNVAAPNPARREGKDVVQSTTTKAFASFASTSIKLRDDDVFESRAEIIRDIMDALANNSNRVVGIYGMGGVGKSTLSLDVERKIREEKSFDWVAKADVSENPDIKRIQGEIAHALGLTEIKNKETISGRARLLHDRLKDKEMEKMKVLIILDNLWEGLNLNKVGIPCGHDNKVIGCKLLLTSRDRDILRREMGCDRDFHLEGLKEEEARRLFERIVGDKVHHDPFKSLVDGALRKCAGSPFLIITVAKYFKSSNFSEWNDALNRIEMPAIEGISEKINKMLQMSYDYLDEEAKSLLQLCAVYGVSEPSLENLLRYSVGLGLFGEISSMEEVRDRFISLIRTLQASSLLLEHGDSDSFKLHDLVRGFVASIASRDHPLLVLKNEGELIKELSEDKIKNCRAICFPYIDMKELPEELDCPELQLFLLFTKNKSLDIPYSLFNSTRKLTVLNFTGIRLTCPPSSFQLLENLHTLCLDGCTLDDVTILGELKGLQILSFVNSKIQRLPKEIGQLVELRLLDLNNCFQLKIIEPGVLGRLIKLEELFMENTFDQWNAMEQAPPLNASLIELDNMKNLYTLYVCIPDPTVLPEDLNVKKLTQYGIQIGGRSWSSRKGSRTLELKLNLKRDVLRKGCIRTALDSADDLYLDKFNGIEQSICELSLEGFPLLKHLRIENSHSVHYILRQPSLPAFRMLESLCLKNLINLEKICHTHISSKSFSILKVVRVESCDSMEVLFPLSLMRELPHLEEIQVVECNLMGEIIEVDDRGPVELCNLLVLELRDLPSIKNFLTIEMDPLSSTSDSQVGTQVAFFSGQQVVFPSLEALIITGMHKIENLWDNQVNFKHLNTLNVSHCYRLTNMFTPTIAWNLVKLTKLRISNCKMLAEVISNERGKKEHVLAFNQLKSMEFDGLIGLRCFSSSGYALVFPLLENVSVSRCPNMKFFSKGSIAAPKLQEVRVSKAGSFWRGNLNDTIQNMYEAMATVADVKLMRLFEFPELIEKWHNELIPNEPFLEIESLVVDNCPLFIEAIPSILMPALLNMRSLQVRDCESLEEIFDFKGQEGVESIQVLPQLWQLRLVNLPKLKLLWNQNFQGRLRFNSLSHLILHNCSNLRHAFALSMIRCLANLEHMEIKECSQMEGVIAEEEEHGSATQNITFPNLWKMELECLPNLTSFSLGKNHMLECPDLIWLTISHCTKLRSFSGQSLMENENSTLSLFTPQVALPSLETLHITGMDNIEMIWDNQVTVNSFHNLKSLYVIKCNNLVNILPSCILGQLHNLESLEAKDCGSLEVVFKFHPLNPLDGHRVSSFPLKKLELFGLPELKHVWDKEFSYRGEFQCLCSINVSRCKNLTSLFPASIARDLMQLEELEINGCGIVELIEKDRLDPKFEFPKLTSLKLKHLTELKCIYTKAHASYWPSLKILEVHDCNKVVILASKPENEMPLHKQPLFLIEKVVFPILETLHITRMDNIEMIWDNQVTANSFPNLVSLCIQECHKLKCIWDKELHRQVKFQCLRSICVLRCKNITSMCPASVARDLIELEELEIDGCGIVELIEKEELVPRFVFPKLTSLKLKHLTELKCIYAVAHASHWPTLKTLEVHDCNKVEILALPPKNEMLRDKQPLFLIEKDSFPILEKLCIISMDNIEIIWDNQVAANSFPNLKSLRIQECSKLKCIWDKELHCQVKFQCPRSISILRCKSLMSLCPASVARDLTQLEELEIDGCGIVELIEKEEGLVPTFVFPKLTFLKLENLTEMKCIYAGTHALHLPTLQSLEVHGCNKLVTLASQPMDEMSLHKRPPFSIEKVAFPSSEILHINCMDNIEMIWGNQIYFQHMKALDVSNCDQLSYMFTHIVAENLVELTELRISNCRRLTEVISDDGGDKGREGTSNQLKNMELDCLTRKGSAMKKIRFPKLREIKLECLPNLISFLSGNNHTLEWPILEELTIANCPKMTRIRSLFPRPPSFISRLCIDT